MNKNYRMYLIIFLLSLSTLAFELIQARVFSYILTYHFVFIIVAFSILAHSLGQLYTSQLRKKQLFSYQKSFLLLVISYPLSILFTLFLSSVDGIGTGSMGLIFYSLFSGVIFFFTGAICADIFQENGKEIGIFYALDLVGAAFGALFGLFLLNNLNIFPALAVILVVISISSLFVLNLSKTFGKVQVFSSVIALLLSITIILAYPDINFQIVKSGDKDLLRIESNPSVKTETIESRWNAFGRTDLVKFTYPDGSNSMSMFIDGAAGTEVFDINKLKSDSLQLRHMLMHSNMFFPFYFLNDNEKRSALIIGPGGGKDIAMAYFGGVKQIDAVEVNPTFVDLMEKYNRSTFEEQPNVRVIVQEGRNFVRNTKNKYDIIFLTIPITKGGRSANFVNLTENYLFTEEALQDYLNVLTDEGRIVFTLHNNEEVYKVLSNYLDIQNSNRLSNKEAFKYLYVADQGMMPLLVIKKTPFSLDEINLRHFQFHRMGFDKGISFFPFVKQIEMDTVINAQNYQYKMFDRILEDISQNKYDFHYVADKALINIHPVKDDSPFFFNYELGLPSNLSILIWAAIILVLCTVYMFKKGWGIKFNKGFESIPTLSGVGPELKTYFNFLGFITFILGFAYILLESFLFQALNLNLNNPIQSFSILLFAFLLGNGAGSFSTKFVKANRMKLVIYSLVAIILVMFLEYYFIFPAIKYSSSYFILFLVVIFPSFLLGIPFPLILRTFSENDNNNGIAILLAISGVAGFIGSVSAIVIAILSGYKFVMFLAFLSYAVIIFSLIVQRNKINKIKFESKSNDLMK